MQQKELDINFMKEELNNKDHTVRILEETIKSLNSDNKELKHFTSNREIAEAEYLNQLKDHIN